MSDKDINRAAQLPSKATRELIDRLFPTDGVYAVENLAHFGSPGTVVQRIVRVRDGIAEDARIGPQPLHLFFDWFELDEEHNFAGIKAVRIEGFTNR